MTTKHAVPATVYYLLMAAVLSSGCFQYRQTAFEVTPAGDCPDRSQGCKDVVWGFVWGAFYASQPAPAECGDVGLTEVTVKTNAWQFLLSLASVGLVAPRDLYWKCARPNPSDGGLGPPLDTAAVVLPPLDSTGGR